MVTIRETQEKKSNILRMLYYYTLKGLNSNLCSEKQEQLIVPKKALLLDNATSYWFKIPMSNDVENHICVNIVNVFIINSEMNAAGASFGRLHNFS